MAVLCRFYRTFNTTHGTYSKDLDNAKADQSLCSHSVRLFVLSCTGKGLIIPGRIEDLKGMATLMVTILYLKDLKKP